MQTNERLELAHNIVENTGTSLFLTGKAGTGKTTFLRALQQQSRKRIVVTAPTGIAAINAGGVTLHSFFQLDFAPFIPGQPPRRDKYRFSKEKLKIIRGMDLLVIDEISMVRADLLDAVDDALRRLRDRHRPFGGVQLLLIGDLQQLAPVLLPNEREIIEKHYRSPYFFDSHALQQIHYETVELNEVFRQNDEDFLELLNAIREHRADRSVLARINDRFIPGFDPDDNAGYIRLVTHNNQAAAINTRKLDLLPTPEHLFEATIEGRFPESSYPADKELRVKVGAQVMFIKNDSETPRRYYNGMIGHVVAIDDEEGIAVRTDDGSDIITVTPVEWENISYSIDEQANEIVEKKEGSFQQYPLKAAWAITIHKSQGLTFSRAIIDATRSFAHGQAYVALSRCRTLQGLVLDNPLPPSAIISDGTVDNYLSAHPSGDISADRLEMMRREYHVQLLDQLFSFRQMFDAMEGIVRIYQENFSRRQPEMVAEWSKLYQESRKEVVDVADRFRNQYTRLALAGGESDELLCNRVKAACTYFSARLEPLFRQTVKAQRNSDNKRVRIKINERLELFEDLLAAKRYLMGAFRTHDFNADIYFEMKARAMLRDENPAPTNKKKGDRKKTVKPSPRKPMDISVEEPPAEYGSPSDFMDIL